MDDEPFEVFTGLWTAAQRSYRPDGTLVETSSCEVAIWRERLAVRVSHNLTLANFRLFHFRQSDGLEFDLRVEGRIATSYAPRHRKNVGVQVGPHAYIFQITVGDAVWYNNQLCLDRDSRVVMGPLLRNGVLERLICQDLKLTAKEVPAEWRSVIQASDFGVAYDALLTETAGQLR